MGRLAACAMDVAAVDDDIAAFFQLN